MLFVVVGIQMEGQMAMSGYLSLYLYHYILSMRCHRAAFESVLSSNLISTNRIRPSHSSGYRSPRMNESDETTAYMLVCCRGRVGKCDYPTFASISSAALCTFCLPAYLRTYLSSFLTCFTCEHYAKLSPLIHFIISRLSMGLIDDNLPGYFPYQLLLRFRQCSGQKANQNGRTGEAPWAKAPTLARA